MTRFILYSCANCPDDNGDTLLFALAGRNVQNDVTTPISCPLCGWVNGLVALKELEIDTESGLNDEVK